MGFGYQLLHLKSVRFQNIKVGMNEVKFGRGGWSSMALQKLVLVTPWRRENPTKKIIGEMLLKLPHTSQIVEMLVK